MTAQRVAYGFTFGNFGAPVAEVWDLNEGGGDLPLASFLLNDPIEQQFEADMHELGWRAASSLMDESDPYPGWQPG